jgi:hypothetical protein
VPFDTTCASRAQALHGGAVSRRRNESIRGALEVACWAAAGAAVQHAMRDVGGGKLLAAVQEADGNIIGLLQSP